MAELAGTVLAAVSVGDPLIRAIRYLGRVCRATKNVPNSLTRLEHTGETICLYLGKVQDGIKQNPSECTLDFAQWLEDERKVLEHLAVEIRDFTNKVHQRLQKSTVLGGVTFAMEESEISNIESRLASHVSILDCMRRICQQESLESRIALLERLESKKLRAQTASSLAVCSESWCNVSSSMDESGHLDDELPYEEVLKKSKAYKRAAMRKLFDSNDAAGESLSLEIAAAAQPVTPIDSKRQIYMVPQTTDEPYNSANMSSFHDPCSYSDIVSTHRSGLHTTSSTYSSSFQQQDSSASPVWNTQDTAPSFSTPITAQSVETWDEEVKNNDHHMSVKVEIEGFGHGSTVLGQFNKGNAYDQVTVTISTLRDDILRSASKDHSGVSVTPKHRVIVTYQTTEESEAGLILPLNPGFLAGAIEELDSGFYSRLLVSATFVKSQPEEMEAKTAVAVLDELKTGNEKSTRRNAAQFPSIESVLGLSHQPQDCQHKVDDQSPWSLKWISNDFIRFSTMRPSIYDLMPDGPEWTEMQVVARGGSSTVYRVKISQSHQSWIGGSDAYALKVLKPEHKHTFEREVEAHSQFASKNHPHIVPLLMAYARDNHFHLLLPWADGTLASVFQCRSTAEALNTAPWIIQQFAGLADALETLHTHKSHPPSKASASDSKVKYWRHGDIKPENILVFQDSQGRGSETGASRGKILKLSDFGLTRFHGQYSQGTSSIHKECTGTVAYMAPDHTISKESDIWSFGAVLAEVLVWVYGGRKSFVFKDGDGRGYLINQDGSIQLHPSFSDLRSWVRQMIDKRRPEGYKHFSSDGNSLATAWEDIHHLVRRCLDLQPEQRPSAREVADSLLVAANDHLGLSLTAKERGSVTYLIMEEFETNLMLSLDINRSPRRAQDP
ncbi:hypothetical protein NUW58_g3850 [Xylaria curta]|uniref:Uncharacterized protein n=1 Tax=Xylaria curta TaxID=42375 RepID=A0ACC1PBC7_9PEZI|nr:hypothetical protein NUW58_g3850 [Xylaria curta]